MLIFAATLKLHISRGNLNHHLGYRCHIGGKQRVFIYRSAFRNGCVENNYQDGDKQYSFSDTESSPDKSIKPSWKWKIEYIPDYYTERTENKHYSAKDGQNAQYADTCGIWHPLEQEVCNFRIILGSRTETEEHTYCGKQPSDKPDENTSDQAQT